jgi:alginate O-acetyltransferase complex protein AlgJ
LIHWNNLLQVRLLKVSPLDRLMLGRDGWLFLAGADLEMDYFRAALPFSEDELARWRTALLQRHIWLERQGIRFIFVFAPNKSTIYPEKVPARIHRAPTRLDQLLEYLRRRPLPAGFRLLDLRKTLRAARSQYPVYGKIDSHWNNFGALLAANKILRALSRFYPLRPPTANDFMVSLEPGAGPRGDLAAMLSLSDVLYEPQSVNVLPRGPLRAIVAEPAHWLDRELEREVTVCPGAELPEALMFRDSFGYAPAGYLSEHFLKITYIRDIGLRFHSRIVLQVRPKIVIQEMAERFLLVVPPVNPPELAAIDIGR